MPIDYGSALDYVDITTEERLQARINELEEHIKWMEERHSAILPRYRPMPNRDSVTQRVAELQSIDLDQEERKWAQAEADVLAAEAAKYEEQRQAAIDNCTCPPCVERREAL